MTKNKKTYTLLHEKSFIKQVQIINLLIAIMYISYFFSFWHSIFKFTDYLKNIAESYK